MEKLSELGHSYLTAQVLDTNIAPLWNLKRQGLDEYKRYSVYESDLTSNGLTGSEGNRLAVREVNPNDRVVFKEIEERTTAPQVLRVNSSADTRYFLSVWQKFFLRYTGYTWWITALVESGKTIGFLRLDYQRYQSKGSLQSPMISDDSLENLPDMIHAAVSWFSAAEKEAITVEIPDERHRFSQYLLEHGWVKSYTWIELIKWLDERAKRKFEVNQKTG